MRALICLFTLGGIAGHLTASAQTLGTQGQGSTPDFSGIYDASGVSIGSSVYSEPDAYPLTDEGERALSAYDHVTADRQNIDDCAPETVPPILWGRTPVRFSQEDGHVTMHFERDDAVRTIHLDGSPPPADQPHSELGYARGRWVGSELRIETTHLVDGYVSNAGHPLSRDARLTERYWRNPGQMDLQMELVVEDPGNFTQPVTLSRVFTWSPEAQVRPWNCISFGDRHEEPDIDELARMLEAL